MKPTIKAFLRDWLPPVLVGALSRSARSKMRFEGVYATWEQALHASSGYDDGSILGKVKDATLKVKRGDAAYERDSVLFDRIEYSWPVLAGLMWAAARDGGRVSVLDFGGSLGTSYFQNRAFLNALTDVRWAVVEQHHYATCGKQYIEDERLKFFNTIDECAAEVQPNVALLSGILQYLRDYETIVQAIVELAPRLIILDRTIVNLEGQKAIYVQRVPVSIYAASYPCYSLPETPMVAHFRVCGYELVSDFESLPFGALKSIGSKFKGYIFQRTDRR
jgi:putative methyltransferase (TIGR04325 family)